MKLAKRQARAKNKKQKYNQQKALKAQQIAARKLNAHRPAASAKPVVEKAKSESVENKSGKTAEQKAAVASNEPVAVKEAPKSADEFSVKHPVETVSAIEKALVKDEFTPTLLGKFFDVGAAKINTLLETLGYQGVKEAGKSREVSPAGEAYLAKAKAAGLTWKFTVVAQLATLDDVTLDQDLVNQAYRSFVLTAQ